MTLTTGSNDVSAQTEELIGLFRSAVLARRCDQIERSLILAGANHFHIGSGGGETNCLVSPFLNPNDCCFLFWRDRALRLARGIPLETIAKCFFDVAGGEGNDKVLTGHESDAKQLIPPLGTPASSHCLPACGAALSQKRSGSTSITICTLGEGSTRQGEFFEAVAFSLEWSLPIVWIVLDNQLAISTRTTGRTAFDLAMIPGERSISVEGGCISGVLASFENAVSKVRSGLGPWFVRHIIPRIGAHTSHDVETSYRGNREIADAVNMDPLSAFRSYIKEAHGVHDDILSGIEISAQEEVEGVYQSVYSQNLKRQSQRDRFSQYGVENSDDQQQTIGDAFRSTLFEIFESHSEAYLLGEDVEDPLGGVFRLTKGLSTAFPSRVINSPLAEASIIGIACGLATVGRLAFAEIQFMDFLSPGWNQLVNNICTQNWRTDGAWPCPVIMYAPAGGYSPGEGMFHSHVDASLLARNDGLVVAYPSTPWDVREVLLLATKQDLPTFILLPKALLWERRLNVPRVDKSGNCEQHAKIVQRGEDVTIATWGNGVWVSLAACKYVSNVTVEVIDMRYLNPLDVETVRRSLSRTGHLVIVDEEHATCSIASDLVRRIVSLGETSCVLKRPPVTVTRLRQHLKCTEEDEMLTLPHPERVAAAIRALIVGQQDLSDDMTL